VPIIWAEMSDFVQLEFLVDKMTQAFLDAQDTRYRNASTDSTFDPSETFYNSKAASARWVI